MARFPVFATSLAVHAATFAILVVLPVFAPDTVPDPGAPPPPLPVWPIHPRVALADSRPTVRPSIEIPSRRQPPSTDPFTSDPVSPTPTAEPEGLPSETSDSAAHEFPGAETASGDGLSAGAGEGPSVGDGPTGGSPGGTGDGGPVRVGGDVRPPTKLRHVNPRYPELALSARISGTVEIDCLIDEGGRVTVLDVPSGHPLLRSAATQAVRQWLYAPTRLNGRPVSVLLTVSVRFEIRS